MSKTTHFTSVTALPGGLTRESVLETLHNHCELIDLQPQVIERHPCKAPSWASAEEYHCCWYSITDKISYLPGVKGKVTYHGCFNDLEDGLQTHVYAPMGLEMKNRWTIGGNMPGEPRVRTELGLGLPKDGLWLREDVEIRCSVLLTSFVKGNMKKAHSRLVDRLIEKAHRSEADSYNTRLQLTPSVRQPRSPGLSLRHSSVSSGAKSPRSPGWADVSQTTARPLSTPYNAPNIQSALSPGPIHSPPPQQAAFANPAQANPSSMDLSHLYHQQQTAQYQGAQQHHPHGRLGPQYQYPPPPPPLPHQQHHYPQHPQYSHNAPPNSTPSPVSPQQPAPIVVRQADGRYMQYIPVEVDPNQLQPHGSGYLPVELPGNMPTFSAPSENFSDGYQSVAYPRPLNVTAPDGSEKRTLTKRESGISGVLSMGSESNESATSAASSAPPAAPPKVPISRPPPPPFRRLGRPLEPSSV